MNAIYVRFLAVVPFAILASACASASDESASDTAREKITGTEDCRALDTLDGNFCYGIATAESYVVAPSHYLGGEEGPKDRELVVLDSITCGNQGKTCLASRTKVEQDQLVGAATISGFDYNPNASVSGQCWSAPRTSHRKRNCKTPVFGGECMGSLNRAGYKDSAGNDHAYLGNGERCGSNRACVVVNDPRARDTDSYGSPIPVSVTGVCEDILGVDYRKSGTPLIFAPTHPCSQPGAGCKTGWDRFR